MYNDYVKKKQEELPSREEVKQEMLDYLDEKYGEEFECATIEYKSWSQSGMEQMEAYPKGSNPNYNFVLNRKTNEDGSATYEDGYIGYLMKEKYAELLEPIVKKYFPVSDVGIGFGKRYTYPESFTKEMSFEEFQEYAAKKHRVGVGVYIAAESEEEVSKQIQSLETELRDLLPIGDFSVTGYTEKAYQTYIADDFYNTKETGRSYTLKGMTFEYSEDWGEIDFNYQYESEE